MSGQKSAPMAFKVPRLSRVSRERRYIQSVPLLCAKVRRHVTSRNGCNAHSAGEYNARGTVSHLNRRARRKSRNFPRPPFTPPIHGRFFPRPNDYLSPPEGAPVVFRRCCTVTPPTQELIETCNHAQKKAFLIKVDLSSFSESTLRNSRET